MQCDCNYPSKTLYCRHWYQVDIIWSGKMAELQNPIGCSMFSNMLAIFFSYIWHPNTSKIEFPGGFSFYPLVKRLEKIHKETSHPFVQHCSALEARMYCMPKKGWCEFETMLRVLKSFIIAIRMASCCIGTVDMRGSAKGSIGWKVSLMYRAIFRLFASTSSAPLALKITPVWMARTDSVKYTLSQTMYFVFYIVLFYPAKTCSSSKTPWRRSWEQCHSWINLKFEFVANVEFYLFECVCRLLNHATWTFWLW